MGLFQNPPLWALRSYLRIFGHHVKVAHLPNQTTTYPYFCDALVAANRGYLSQGCSGNVSATASRRQQPEQRIPTCWPGPWASLLGHGPGPRLWGLGLHPDPPKKATRTALSRLPGALWCRSGVAAM